MIHFTGYGVIAEKPRVGQLGAIFRCTLEKLYVGSKNECTFFDSLDELYHHAKFGEDRTMRAGCRCENVVFVCLFLFLLCSEAGALFARLWHTLNRCCVAVYGSILMMLIPFFSALIAVSNALGSSDYCCYMAPQVSRNCGRKFWKVQKSV